MFHILSTLLIKEMSHCKLVKALWGLNTLSTVGMEPIPAPTGWEAGYTLSELIPVTAQHHLPTRVIHTIWPRSPFSICSCCFFSSGGWEDHFSVSTKTCKKRANSLWDGCHGDEQQAHAAADTISKTNRGWLVLRRRRVLSTQPAGEKGEERCFLNQMNEARTATD